MEKKEYAVGEEFQCGLVKLKCIEDKGGLRCCDCFLDSTYDDCCIIVGECFKRYRSDNKDVIFIEVEE